MMAVHNNLAEKKDKFGCHLEGLDESSAESEEEEAEEDEDAEDELAADNVPILQSSGVGWGEETSEEVPAEPITEGVVQAVACYF